MPTSSRKKEVKARRRVAVVNDDPLQRAVVIALLGDGYDCIGFSGPEEALEHFSHAPPVDLVITDLHMPKVDGWAFCRLLRSKEFKAFNSLPILVVSATYSGEDPHQVTADLGANAFLSMPVDPEDFSLTVKRLLQGKSRQVNPRVLLVEDSLPLLNLLSRVFTLNGYQVRSACTGAEALQIFQEETPDVAVLDFHLPDMNSDLLLQEMRTRDPGVAVVIMTADSRPELALRVTRLGARAYLQKPFDPGYLLALCARARREMSLLRVETLLEERTRELRESESRLRIAMEVSRDALWDWNLATGACYVSPRYHELLGHPSGISSPSLQAEQDLMPPEDRQRMAEIFRELGDGRRDEFQEEFRLQIRPETWVSIHSRGRVVERDGEGRAKRVVGIHSDITERKQAADALRASKEKLARVFYLSPSAITISRLKDGMFFDVNQSFCERTGYSREEVLGHSSLDLGLWVDPAQRSAMEDRLAADGEFSSLEVHLRARNGRVFTGLMSGKVVDLDHQPSLLCITTDITDLRRIEEERGLLEEQLRQAQKLESVGHLAGGVAHDFNNLLSPILAYAELLLGDFGPGDSRRERVEQILRAGHRGRDLTRQLLAFSRKQMLDLKPIRLASIVQGFSKLLRRTLREDIHLQLDIGAEQAHIRADAGQIEQVIMNLAVNAQDAMPHGGMLSLGVTGLHLPEPDSHQHPGIPAGDYLLLGMGDTGVGMAPEILDHIFEPFFTTKEVGKGSGLGLSTVFGIVRQHEGHIRVESVPGAGTTFRIYLPTCQALRGLDAPTEEATPSATQGCLLLVEDDPLVRESTLQLLLSRGFHVRVHESASACLRAQPQEPSADLLLTDVVMPDMSGPELYEHMRRSQPELRVIYMSGYTPDAIAHHGVWAPGTAFLQKPFTTEELVQRIAKALE